MLRTSTLPPVSRTRTGEGSALKPKAPKPGAKPFASHLRDADHTPPAEAPALPLAVVKPVTAAETIAALVQQIAGAIHAAIARPVAPPAAVAPPPAEPADDAAALATEGNATAAREIVMTPLEQAVHALLQEVASTETAPSHELAPALPTAHVLPRGDQPDAPAADAGKSDTSIAPLAAVAAAPVEAPSNPSHVHLVVDDGAARVIVTVAVRGSEVRVALRTSDDAIAAGLARNAASLDHALHIRGLDLGEFSSESDAEHPRREHEREHEPEQEQHADRSY